MKGGARRLEVRQASRQAGKAGREREGRKEGRMEIARERETEMQVKKPQMCRAEEPQSPIFCPRMTVPAVIV